MEDLEGGDENTTLLTSEDNRSSSNHVKHSPSVESSDEKLTLHSLSRRQKIIACFMTLTFFLTGNSLSLLAPFFPQEAEKRGVSSTVTGLIFSSFEFVIFVSSPFFGNYLTKLGPRFTFLSGLFVAGSCSALFGLLDKCPPGTPFIVISFACRCFEGLGFAAVETAGFAMISNEFPKSIATVFGLLETAHGIGLMVGPAIGGGLYELGGYGLPFYFIGVVVVASSTAMFFILPEFQDIEEERTVSIVTLLRCPLIVFSSVSVAVAALGIMFQEPTLSKHLEPFLLSPAIIGLIFVIPAGLYGLTSPFWGYVSDKKQINGWMISSGNLMCAVSYLFLGPTPFLTFLPQELWVIILGLVIGGLFLALTFVPVMNCYLLGAVELGFENNLDTFGIISGLFNSVFCLGSFTGPVIGGFLIENIGFAYGSTIISGLHLLATVACGSFFLLRHLQMQSRSSSSV